MKLTLKVYQEILSVIESEKLVGCQQVLEARFPDIPNRTLGSILANQVQKSMKATHAKHNTKANIQSYYERYCAAVANKEEPGIILRLAEEIKITPVLVARFILEQYLKDKLLKDTSAESDSLNESSSSDRPNSKTESNREQMLWMNIRHDISTLIKNTGLIADKDLAYEVYLCTVHDEHYGPVPETIKLTIGHEYENILQKMLEDMKISFMDENMLRQKGYDKTPDFKLDVPIALNGNIICWIESKATFGDEQTHQTYLTEQLTSYWNRFGPGLVIYWLGYLETLESKTPKGIYVSDNLSTDLITFFNPEKITKEEKHKNLFPSSDITSPTNPFNVPISNS